MVADEDVPACFAERVESGHVLRAEDLADELGVGMQPARVVALALLCWRFEAGQGVLFERHLFARWDPPVGEKFYRDALPGRWFGVWGPANELLGLFSPDQMASIREIAAYLEAAVQDEAPLGDVTEGQRRYLQ